MNTQRLPPIDPVMTIVLGVVTLGVYPLIKFYEAGTAWAALLPGRPNRFNTLFWVYTGLYAGSILTSWFLIGLLLVIPLFVVTFILLKEVLALRDEVIRVHAPAAASNVAPASTHWMLMIGGCVLSILVIGIFAIIYQAYRFFLDYDAIAKALPAAERAPVSGGFA